MDSDIEEIVDRIEARKQSEAGASASPGSEAATDREADLQLLEAVQTLLGQNKAGQESVLCHNLRLIFQSSFALRWTYEKPAVKGWYFYRWNPCAAMQVYEVGPDWTQRLFAWRAEFPRMISEMPGMWAGPIKMPLMPYQTEPQNNQDEHRA